MSASEEQLNGAVVGAMEDQHEDVDIQQVAEFAKAMLASFAWPHYGNDNPEYDGWMEEQMKAVETISQRGVQTEGEGKISFEFGYDGSSQSFQDIMRVLTEGNVGVKTHKEGEAVYGDDLLAGRTEQAKGGTIHEIPPSWQNEPVMSKEMVKELTKNVAKLVFGSNLEKARDAIRSAIIGIFPTIARSAIRFKD